MSLVKDSLPAQAELICLLQAMACGLPVVYLDPGLAQALRSSPICKTILRPKTSTGRRFV
jgi:hypothetical protein